MNKQSEILEYINHKLITEGSSPSIREIAKAVNLKSTSSVQYHLDNLIKKGFLNVYALFIVLHNVVDKPLYLCGFVCVSVEKYVI